MNNYAVVDMYSEDEIELVVARLRAIPENAIIAMGSMSHIDHLTKEKLIEHVKCQDEIGRKIIEMQLKYLRSYK